MSVQASVVLATARTLLNDDAATNWTDASLFPKLQQAHKELQAKLKRAAAELMKNTYVETLGVGATVFTTQPSDIIAPIQLWEKAAADPITSYILMTESDPLPNVTQAATLIYWSWVKEIVTFIGSSASRTVKMTYWRSIPIPNVPADPIGFIDGELYLAPRTAAIATGSTGQAEEMKILTALANESLADVIFSNRGRAPQIPGGSVRP